MKRGGCSLYRKSGIRSDMPAKYHRQALLRTLPATIPPPLTGSDKTAVRPVWPDNAPPLPIFRRGAKTCDTAKGPAIGRREAPGRSVSKQKGRNEWQSQRLRRKASGKAKEIRVLLTNAPIKANDAET